MPPRKSKRKAAAAAAAAKSIAEEVVSSKKSRKANKEDDVVVASKRPLKRLRKAIIDSEPTPEEVESQKKIVEDKKGDDAKEPVPAPKVRKPCTWLKLDRLDPEFGKKSVDSSKQGKESEHVAEDNKRKRYESCEEKGPSHGYRKEVEAAAEAGAREDNKRKRDEKREEKVRSYPVTDEREKELIKEIDNKSKRDEKRVEKGRSHPVTGEREKELIREIDNKRKRDEKREEKGRSHKVTDEREKELIKEIDDESEKELGGLIFMCNSKTKPDCFRYQIMGVPAHKKEVVMGIKPGLKFFLYDYDLKLMYGVFEASSPGGMKLEPAAFNGAFPAQVRFVVHKACLPLPESVFKKAIKGSYDEKRRKFDTELTVKQVRNLIGMFNPTPLLQTNGKSVAQEPTLCPIPPPTSFSEEYLRQRYLTKFSNSHTPLRHENQFPDNHVIPSPVPHRDPLFLSEQEYRSNGLQQGGDNVSNRPGLDLELKHLLRNPPSMSIEANKPDRFHLSEKEYRAYGLRAPPVMPEPRKNPHYPYEESTTSLVNRYLSMPLTTTSVPSESYPRAGRERYDRGFAPHDFREQSVYSQRSYSLNASHEPSERRRGEAGLASAPVSSRYSFAGPSLSRHR